MIVEIGIAPVSARRQAASGGFDLASTYRKDTLPLNAGERYDAILEADNPGTWMVHCHNLLHVGDNMSGLAFNLIVE